MMFVLTRKAKTRRPFAGVPWRDLNADEYEAANARVQAATPDQPIDLVALGYFEKVSDAEYKRRAQAPADDAGAEVNEETPAPPAVVDEEVENNGDG